MRLMLSGDNNNNLKQFQQDVHVFTQERSLENDFSQRYSGFLFYCMNKIDILETLWNIYDPSELKNDHWRRRATFSSLTSNCLQLGITSLGYQMYFRLKSKANPQCKICVASAVGVKFLSEGLSLSTEVTSNYLQLCAVASILVCALTGQAPKKVSIHNGNTTTVMVIQQLKRLNLTNTTIIKKLASSKIHMVYTDV